MRFDFVPSVAQLISVNGKLNRRIRHNSEDVLKFETIYGEPIRATPVNSPQVLRSASVYHPIGIEMVPEELRDKPYYFDSDGETFLLNDGEARLLLGEDGEHSISRMNAMLEACASGPGLANAYVLGSGLSMGTGGNSNYLAVPVQYYKISEEAYVALGVERIREVVLSKLVANAVG
jgi:hypothetical protein